jgi:hypothetical protein
MSEYVQIKGAMFVEIERLDDGRVRLLRQATRMADGSFDGHAMTPNPPVYTVEEFEQRMTKVRDMFNKHAGGGVSGGKYWEGGEHP